MKKYNKITAFVLSLALASGPLFFTAERAGAFDWFYSEFELKDTPVRGDMNHDKQHTSEDVKKLLDILLGKQENKIDPYIFDVDSDGSQNVIDLIKLKSAVLDETRIWSYNNLPVMDGSTSAIPLEAGMKSRILGVPYYFAKNSVKHHKTHESFQMLLSGDIDMIFTVPISESQ